MKEREINMDYLRIVCCFLIVLLHFSSSYWDCVPIDSFSFRVMSIYNCLTRVSVPIFIMLSGYFLLESKGEMSWKKYLNRPLKLLCVFYVWSFFYAFQGLAVEAIKTGNVTPERWDYSKKQFVFGHYHMWFCFLIIGYYLLLPIARKIAEDVKIMSLFLLLWLMVAYVIPCICSWAKLSTIFQYYSQYELNAVKGYWGYFFLGYFIKKCEWKKSRKSIVFILGLLSLGITIFLTLFQSATKGEYVDTWFSPGSPFVLLMSAALFLLFYSIKIPAGEKKNRFVINVSECTFFIYMFHVFLLEKGNSAGINTVSFNPLFAVPILSVGAFGLSLLIALGVRKIPFIGKILLYK